MNGDVDLWRFFLLDPDSTYEVTCPDCGGSVSIDLGVAYPAGDGEGTELDWAGDLGDLADAANAHECNPDYV